MSMERMYTSCGELLVPNSTVQCSKLYHLYSIYRENSGIWVKWKNLPENRMYQTVYSGVPK